MSNLILPPFTILDYEIDSKINLKVTDQNSNCKNNQNKSLDFYDETSTSLDENLYTQNNENLINNEYISEKYLQDILGINKPKSNKRKIGILKEGYLQFYKINPINRYNFIIDRYNEDVNRKDNLYLTKVPILKIFSRFFDLYIYLSRILLGVFLIIIYHFYSYIYKQNSNTMNKAKLITYKKYLLNDNNFYTQSDKPSCLMVFVCILLLIFSLFLIFSLYFVMLFPNCLFTLYLGFAAIIHYYNNKKINNTFSNSDSSSNIFENMVFENKLDDKSLLNDYIKINKNALKYYKGFSYYDKIKEVYNKKNKNESIYIMLYGNLFVREYNIINKSFFLQMIGFGLYLVIGYLIYI